MPRCEAIQYQHDSSAFILPNDGSDVSRNFSTPNRAARSGFLFPPCPHASRRLCSIVAHLLFDPATNFGLTPPPHLHFLTEMKLPKVYHQALQTVSFSLESMPVRRVEKRTGGFKEAYFLSCEASFAYHVLAQAKTPVVLVLL